MYHDLIPGPRFWVLVLSERNRMLLDGDIICMEWVKKISDLNSISNTEIKDPIAQLLKCMSPITDAYTASSVYASVGI